MKVTVVNQQKEHKWDKAWSRLIRKTVTHAGKLHKLPAATEVNVVIVDKQYMQELNHYYRGVDKPTDVLSFAITETRDEEPFYDAPEEDHMLGDIVICLDVAIAQAAEYNHPVERELAFLTVHGMLHLLGYDHEDENERVLMRSFEERILNELGITRG